MDLGQRVPIEWIARDFKARGKLPNDVQSYSLAEDHRSPLPFQKGGGEGHDSSWRPLGCRRSTPGHRTLGARFYIGI